MVCENCGGGGARHAFGSAEQVSVACRHRDGLASLSQRHNIGSSCCSRYRSATSLPLEADGAKAVKISKCMAGGERLTCRRISCYGYTPCRGIIDIGNRGGRRTGDTFCDTFKISIACFYRYSFSNLGL